MARSSLEAFSVLWRAYGEGRLSDSLDLVDPECELTLLDGVGPVRGHDGVRDCLAAAQREWKTLRIVYDDLFEDHPGCVVGSGRLAASPPRGPPAPASTGRSRSWPSSARRASCEPASSRPARTRSARP